MMPSAGASAAWMTFVVFFLGRCVSSFLFVPEELPSFLQVIYAKIPPLKKGTDSKFGIGLRFGDYADFQILLELGPQPVTEPLNNDIDFDFKKETTLKSTRKPKFSPGKHKLMQQNKNVFKKMRLNLKQPNEKEYFYKKSEEKSEGSQWLAKWKREFVRRFTDTIAPPVTPGLPIKTISRRFNRMKVVESTSNHSSGRNNNDLIILRRLFENAPR